MSASHPRVAVIGDIGGHADALRAALRDLGVDPDRGTVPEDLTVVQAGDLVHRGPDSPAVLDIVDACSRSGRWVQLVGNHEACYLDGAPSFDRGATHLHHADAARIRRWWATGQLRAAAAIRGAHGDVLVTHAGLSRPFWELLGAPGTADAAAAAIDTLARRDPPTAFAAGALLHGADGRLGGPVWADAVREVAASWRDDMPFDQVHGHSGPYDWDARRWRAGRRARRTVTLDVAARHSVTRLAGRTLVGIDPKLGLGGHGDWAPLVLDDAAVTVPA